MSYKKMSLTPFQLSSESKRALYSPFFFYNLSSLFFQRAETTKNTHRSFKKVFLKQVLFFENSLLRVRIICRNKSFLYLDSGTKYTLVKPKFRIPQKFLLPKELLFFSYKSFYRAINYRELKSVLRMFQYTPIKGLNTIFNRSLFLKKLVVINTKSLSKFFVLTVKTKFLSKSQKQMNFIQFTTSF